LFVGVADTLTALAGSQLVCVARFGVANRSSVPLW
jgi:hypothetical protein